MSIARENGDLQGGYGNPRVGAEHRDPERSAVRSGGRGLLSHSGAGPGWEMETGLGVWLRGRAPT